MRKLSLVLVFLASLTPVLAATPYEFTVTSDNHAILGAKIAQSSKCVAADIVPGNPLKIQLFKNTEAKYCDESSSDVSLFTTSININRKEKIDNQCFAIVLWPLVRQDTYFSFYLAPCTGTQKLDKLKPSNDIHINIP